MELNQSPEQKIGVEFKKRRLRQLLVGIPLLPAMIFLLLTTERGTKMQSADTPLVAALAALVFGALIFSFWNWRCPSCGKYLGKAINPKFCNKCGTKLQ